MPKQARTKQARPAPPSGKRAGSTQNAQAAQGQLAMAVREIEKAMGDIQRGLARAERRIEADARQRIRSLKKEGRAQMRALEGKRRDATRLLSRLSAAAGGSWDDVTHMVQATVTDARNTAVAVVDRFRGALS
jgi:hypothetical protein